MSSLVALELLAGVTALLWVTAAMVRSVRDWPYRHNRDCGGRTVLDHVPQLFLASAVSGGVAVFLDALQ